MQKRNRVHKYLGFAAVPLAVLVVGLSAHITVLGALHEARLHIVGGFTALLGFNLCNLALFTGLLAGGFAFRHRPDFHKRLMLLAAFSLLPPAIARIVAIVSHDDLLQLLGVDAFVVLVVAIDVFRCRRIHPAFAWGTVILLVPLHIALAVVQTASWAAFVSRTLG